MDIGRHLLIVSLLFLGICRIPLVTTSLHPSIDGRFESVQHTVNQCSDFGIFVLDDKALLVVPTHNEFRLFVQPLAIRTVDVLDVQVDFMDSVADLLDRLVESVLKIALELCSQCHIVADVQSKKTFDRILEKYRGKEAILSPRR